MRRLTTLFPETQDQIIAMGKNRGITLATPFPNPSFSIQDVLSANQAKTVQKIREKIPESSGILTRFYLTALNFQVWVIYALNPAQPDFAHFDQTVLDVVASIKVQIQPLYPKKPAFSRVASLGQKEPRQTPLILGEKAENIDTDIADLVQSLNDYGIRTLFSCLQFY